MNVTAPRNIFLRIEIIFKQSQYSFMDDFLFAVRGRLESKRNLITTMCQAIATLQTILWKIAIRHHMDYVVRVAGIDAIGKHLRCHHKKPRTQTLEFWGHVSQKCYSHSISHLIFIADIFVFERPKSANCLHTSACSFALRFKKPLSLAQSFHYS